MSGTQSNDRKITSCARRQVLTRFKCTTQMQCIAAAMRLHNVHSIEARRVSRTSIVLGSCAEAARGENISYCSVV